MSIQFDTLTNFYDGTMGWPMEQMNNDTVLSVNYQGRDAQWVFVAAADEDNDIVILFSRSPYACPDALFPTMGEFLERANFGMTHGAWVMDRSDGEIRYRVGIDLAGLDLTDECLKTMTLHTNLTMERYLPGLEAILNGGKTAENAFSIVFPT